MRIPLQSLPEIVSLWPGSIASNNRRRKILAAGIMAASGLSMRACQIQWGDRDLGITMQVESNEEEPLRRFDTLIYELGERFLLKTTNQALTTLEFLIDSWTFREDNERKLVLQGIGLIGRRAPDFEYHADLQIFLLGYYYAALAPLLDTKQLPVQEAFGSWGWNDIEFLDKIRSLTKTRLNKAQHEGALYWRYQILKLIAYLFVGAQDDQLAQVQFNVFGVLGKMALLSASLLGEADTSEKVAGFSLLILDPASVPKNQKGLIFAGKQPKCSVETSSDYAVEEESVASPPLRGPDFTSHIEPDWEYDTNHALVVYRYQRRIVH